MDNKVYPFFRNSRMTVTLPTSANNRQMWGSRQTMPRDVDRTGLHEPSIELPKYLAPIKSSPDSLSRSLLVNLGTTGSGYIRTGSPFVGQRHARYATPLNMSRTAS